MEEKPPEPLAMLLTSPARAAAYTGPTSCMRRHRRGGSRLAHKFLWEQTRAFAAPIW